MQVIRCLLELDANVDAPGPHGMSAAFFACSRGTKDWFEKAVWKLSSPYCAILLTSKFCTHKHMQFMPHASLRPKALKMSSKSFAKLGPRPMQETSAAPGMESFCVSRGRTFESQNVTEMFFERQFCLRRKDVGRDDPRGAFGIGEALGDLQCPVDRGQPPGQESLVDCWPNCKCVGESSRNFLF